MSTQQPNPKTFTFKSGVTVETTKDKITASAPNYNKVIHSIDLDNFSHTDHHQQRLTFVGLLARMFVVGLLLLIVNKILFGKIHLEQQAIYLGVILMAISFLGFLLLVIDSWLEMGISNNIMNNFFSNKGYYVTIGNKSGNNIELIAQLDDIQLIKELELKIYELKKSATKQDNPVIQTQNSNLDELKKLAELLDAGIIEQDEFDKKKKQLLELN